MPDHNNVMRGVLLRGQIFLKRAGTLLASLMVLLWFLSTFPAAPANATLPAIDYSFAGMIGHFIHPLLAPIGFTWQMAVALIPGMAAREVAVGALGTVYAVSGNAGGTLAATPGIAAIELATPASMPTLEP